MITIKRSLVFSIVGLMVFLIGCGSDGPLGNNAPQGRPEWMKKKDNAPTPPAPPAEPQKQ